MRVTVGIPIAVHWKPIVDFLEYKQGKFNVKFRRNTSHWTKAYHWLENIAYCTKTNILKAIISSTKEHEKNKQFTEQQILWMRTVTETPKMIFIVTPKRALREWDFVKLFKQKTAKYRERLLWSIAMIRNSHAIFYEWQNAISPKRLRLRNRYL